MSGVNQVLMRLRAAAGKGLLRETLGGTAVTMAITGVGAVVSFLMFSMAARRLGLHEFGIFSTWFSAASFLAVCAGCGQETLIVRAWAEYSSSGRYALARGALVFGITLTVMASTLVATGVLGTQALLGLDHAIALAAAAFIISQTLMHYSTNASHNIVGYFVGQGSADVSWRLLVLLAIVLPFTASSIATASALIWMIALAQIILVTVQFTSIYFVLPRAVHTAKSEMLAKEWSWRGFRMWIAAIVEASSQYTDVIIVSLLTDTVTAGAYFAVTRVANIFARVSSAMASFARRKIAPLYFTNRLDELKVLARSMTWITMAVVAAGLIVVLILGKTLLGIFGPRFEAEMPALIILTLGTAALALSGPAPVMLQHTGHEGVYARIVAYAFAARTVLMLGLVPLFNTEGAALAWTISALGMAIAINIACRARVGIDPSPLGLLRRDGGVLSTATATAGGQHGSK